MSTTIHSPRAPDPFHEELQRGTVLEVFAAFLKLGPTSFGGPVAHLGFAPAFLLVLGALPFWEAWRRRASVQQAMAGVNASVVGVLGAALYDPVWTSAVHSKADFALALAAFGLLVYGRVSPFLVVLGAAMAGWALA